MFRFLLLHNS